MSETLTLEYNLAELPSSQHRAGLAGLVLMVRWLKDEPNKKGVCEISQIDETSATLQIDQEGLQFLFDKVYAAFLEDRAEPNIRTKGKGASKKEVPPLRVEKRILTDKKGKTTEKTYYIYAEAVPRGAFLADYDVTFDGKNGSWVKLWRDFVWNIMLVKPTTRNPYKKRTEEGYSKDAETTWSNLIQNPSAVTFLKSNSFIGAMEFNAELVEFQDNFSWKFLLNFWTFATPIYLTRISVYDRKSKSIKTQYQPFTLAIPDISNLEDYCDDYLTLLKTRRPELIGASLYPSQCIVDLASEGAMDFALNLSSIISEKEKQIGFDDLLTGVDLIHIVRDGDSAKIVVQKRITPTRTILTKYQRIKHRFNDNFFRRQRTLNVLNEKDWFYGFNSLLSKTDLEQTIGNFYFGSDVRKAFEDIGVTNKLKGADEMNEENYIPSLVYQLVSNYLRLKVDSKFPEHKYQSSWKGQNSPQKNKHYELRGDIARKAFLAVRSRTESDFTDYFVSTLCSFPQFLKQEDYVSLANELHNNSDKVRTLTMLALSANGYSPKSDKQGEEIQ